MRISIFAVLVLLVASACQNVPPEAPKPTDDTPLEQSSLIRGKSGVFEARCQYVIAVPAGAKQFHAWMPLPQTDDSHQEVRNLQVEITPAGFTHEQTRDARGNTFLHITSAAAPPAGSLTVVTTFTVERWEVKTVLEPASTRPHTPSELEAMKADLADSAMSVTTPEIKAFAERSIDGTDDPISASRQIYDAVLARIEYHVKDPKSNLEKTMKATGTGDSVRTFESGCGNCTDFHSLYAAMSRSVNIPTRVVYGSFFKGPLAAKAKDQSYHCWIEFHAPNIGWIPLDVAVADIFVPHSYNQHSKPRANLTVADGYDGPDESLVEYYFGNIEERRVVWHRGRDLVMTPAQQGDPLLWNPKGYCEVDGKPVAVKRTLTFR